MIKTKSHGHATLLAMPPKTDYLIVKEQAKKRMPSIYGENVHDPCEKRLNH
jgi:hypothetical protein